MDYLEQHQFESPKYLRMSLAAAMTLDFKKGLFYRNAKLFCINLLLTYGSGCVARCAYCGLSSQRAGQSDHKSFIRVVWPTHALDEIIQSINRHQDRVKRICVSQVTHKNAGHDTYAICRVLRGSYDIPISLLVAPTTTTRKDLMAYKTAGADKIGVAIDLATPDLFDQYRGAGVNGPHRWETYLERLVQAIEIFGRRNAGAHFICGMGETEKELVTAIQMVQDMGGWTHLFSFFPEAGSRLEDRPAPPMDKYRRIQLARFLIDEGLTRLERFVFDESNQIVDYGISHDRLEAVIDSGNPFRTSGCAGYDGQVACNRPYANSRPGPDIRNYPFPPDRDDMIRIRGQMGLNLGKVS
jgi:biotin synthase